MLFTTTALLTLLTSPLALAVPQTSSSSATEFVALGDTGCNQDADCIGNAVGGGVRCRIATLPILDANFVPVAFEEPALRCVGGFGPRPVCGSNLDCTNLNCGCTTEDDGVGVCCALPGDEQFGAVLSGGANGNGA